MARGLAALAAAVSLVACSPGAVSEVAGETRGHAVSRLRVGLTEWAITTQQRALAPGRVTLHVTNAGATAHDLAVHTRSGSWRTPLLAPGESATLEVLASPGEQVHLDCGVAGHHAAGMHAVLPVVEEGAAR